MTQLLRADNEWRFDLLDEQYTLVARNRRVLEPLRVGLPPAEERLRAERRCPFCEDAPAHVIERVADEDGREVLALPSPTPLTFVEDSPPPAGPFTSAGALGAHELLVASTASLHGASLPNLDEGWLALLLLAFARRRADLAGDRRLLGISLTLPPPTLSRFDHAHGALLATPFAAPRWASAELCPACRELTHARAHGRVLVEREGVAAWIPFAPRADVHVRIASASHGTAALAEDSARTHCQALAKTLVEVVARVTRAAPGAVLLLSSRPLPLADGEGSKSGHLVLDLEMLFGVDAPLAHGLGARVVSLPPEELAERLRAL